MITASLFVLLKKKKNQSHCFIEVYRMNFVSHNLRDQISELLKPHRVCLVTPVVLNHSGQPSGRSANRFVVLSLWRGYLVIDKQPVRVESTFSYLEICSINIHSLTQIVLETDSQTLSFSVLHVKDLEAMVNHMTTSLKRIFPDSSPGTLLKTIPPDLQQRLLTLTDVIEDQLKSRPGSCGGFSDTYAALCDFNEMPIKEEIQWDVDNIYYINNRREFNLQDFSHLDSRDLAIAVAALSFNQWFTKIYCKELKLSVDIQQQLIYLLSRSPSLEELSLEASGLKLDFAVKMTEALLEHTSSTLQSINLSGNPIEDKGVIALSQVLGNLAEGLKHLSLSRVSMTARGLGYLSQVLSSTQLLSASLTHLDLSGNPSSLVTEEATFLFKFLSSTNSLSHLDLSDTNCPLDTLFVSLSAGCCYKLMHLNLARNPFSHRKVREVTRSIGEFFSQSCELKYVGLSATKLPPQALRLLLQGLATNTRLFGLELDLSSCELRSAGAQVIQEHISEATAIRSLDISDNGFENDMVTLVLSVGRCHSLRRLALGRNFAMKSRALSDVLHRIAQLIQDEECPLQSLSVCDSKLKTGMHILLSALGGRSALAEVDISGNNMGDTGAKMLAKALMSNTRLRSLAWDRNNVTARGFQDVADALERNFTLQQVSGLADVTQSYRSNPDRTKEALHKIQQCLDRNNQRQLERVEPQQVFRAQQSEKQVQGMCQQLEDSLQRLNHCDLQEVQDDILTAQEVLHNARESFKLLPSLYEAGRKYAFDGDSVNCILADTATALTNEFNRSIQELAQGLMRCAEAACPRLVQRSSVCECLSECVSKRNRQTHAFLRSTLVENAGPIISNRLSELRQTLSVSLAESIIEQVLQDLTKAQDKMDCLMKENSCTVLKLNIPELRLGDSDFPTDDYSPAFWRNSFHSKSLRPAASIKSLLDADWEQQTRDGGAERERGGGAEEDGGGGGGGRCGLPRLPTATPLSVRFSSPSPSPSPYPPGPRGRRRREEEVVAVDAAAAISGARGASFIPPPSLPLLYPVSARAAEEEAAGRGGLPRRQAPFPGCGPSPGPLPGSGSPASPMEPLPTQGQILRHYTASRPRPRRTHTQPPSSRPQMLVGAPEDTGGHRGTSFFFSDYLFQEPVSKVENEVSEGMGRVDEGVEEFFTKKIIPDYALKGRWEESIPAQATPSESSSTPSASTPFSPSSDNITSSATTTVTSPSVPSTDTSFTSTDVSPLSTSSTPPTPSSVTTTTTTTPLPTKNIKKKFGDFFAFKRARASRAAKAGGGEGGGGGGEGVKVKRTSIADLIRPLREAKERERERERDKEREKGRGARSVEDANVSNDAATTEGTVATSHHLAGDAGGTMAPAKTLTTPVPSSETTPSYPTVATSPDLTTATLSNLEEEAVPVLPDRTPSPVVTSPLTEQERSGVQGKEMKLGGTPYGERRLKVTKRSLREGKSQSLILLTGLEPEDKDDTHSKKHASESTSSFEQRLQVMLHRMGVAKSPPADTKASQNKDEELRKANSEGAILDKPVPPPTFMKPRTMSTSSADPRHPMRAHDPFRPDPPLYPKPTVPERPIGPLPPKPAIAAKPPLPTPASPAGGGGARPSSAPPSSSSAGRVQLRAHTIDGRPEEATAQNGSQEHPWGAASAPSSRKELLPPAPSPWRATSTQDRPEKAQSVTDEILPKSRQHMKPLPQRRAVSVHEDALAMTQELKAVLQRSPIRFRGNRGDLPTCTEDPSSGEEAQRAQEAGKPTAEEKKEAVKKEEELKAERRRTGCGGTVAETKHPPLGEEETPGSGCPSSTAPAQQEARAPRLFSPTAALNKAPSVLERPPALTLSLEKPLVTPPSEKKSPSTVPPLLQTLEKRLVSPPPPPPQEKTPGTIPAASESPENPQVSPLSHKKKSPGTAPGTADVRNSTQERGEAASKQHTVTAEPADQRTEPPLSE
ncbi:capping protein, Arp2/3 and myosin-I linker protein 2 isoform X4 [Sebastes umbrosus]|uniref:capping protein, Arp2/3 and myosin-I linker protein 2 isoform X4 n=1 Tax=Sebastes umbrosus TaxID=72105 RepID=UPI0018A001AC|nr:capping protein, Arp2/3 and myosin-I linker protein 2 isoform X4 [Sebastes umbrosus]